MGRSGKYETCVKPFLAEIKEWYKELNEGQIAKRLGIGSSSWERYKEQHAELRECLARGKVNLAVELKETLRQKARGFYYEERKTIIEHGVVAREEVYRKYAPPDTGAIHLLLKNVDDDWRNDDKRTMDIKAEELELKKQRSEEW